MKKVLIICTGNSCRSSMAEALINHYLKDEWQAFSAGTHPSRVNPLAIMVLQELGIETDYLRSKSVREFLDRDDLDLAITVCDHARENCPVFINTVEKHHMGFDDPVIYISTDIEQSLEKFRRVRDDIIARLLPFVKER